MEEKKTKEPQYNEPKMMLHLAIIVLLVNTRVLGELSEGVM